MKFVRRSTEKDQVSDISRSVNGSPFQGMYSANEAELSATQVARKILRIRADINGILAPLDLPISPVLDMLLDLFISEEDGRKVSVTDVAIAGHCSPTTGLRWVGVLANAGMVRKTSDDLDHRRIYVSMTDRGRIIAGQCIAAYTLN